MDGRRVTPDEVVPACADNADVLLASGGYTCAHNHLVPFGCGTDMHSLNPAVEGTLIRGTCPISCESWPCRSDDDDNDGYGGDGGYGDGFGSEPVVHYFPVCGTFREYGTGCAGGEVCPLTGHGGITGRDGAAVTPPWEHGRCKASASKVTLFSLNFPCRDPGATS